MSDNTSKKTLFTVIVILLAGAGTWFLTQQRSVPDIKHVVLISMDTTRADYLSCYGYKQKTTPNIDKLADKGYLFKETTTTIPLTLPAHTSMLTGTIPPHHGKHENKDPYFDPSNVTLAELLKMKGYSTGAFVGAQILNRSFGLNRGFDTYQDEFAEKGASERRGEEVNRAAFDWLEKQKDSPVFLFLHYYDPHDDYDPPEPFAAKFKDSPYAGEIAYTDYCIGKVVDKLKKLDMYDSSLIIVTGDHGELLGEHGESGHMYFIYENAIKVPMIYKLPGSNGPKKINDIAGIVDIVPTVCDLLKIEPPSPIEGKSLAEYFTDTPPEPAERYLYCESLYPTKYDANTLLSLVGTRWKYIQTTRPELYDLQNDPGELKNLVETDKHRHRARILKDRLKQVLEQTVRKEKNDQDAPLSPEALKHLQSLGYVGSSSVVEDFRFDQTKTDPKDMIAFHEQFRKINNMFVKKIKIDIGPLGDKLIRMKPDFFESYDLLQGFAIQQKDFNNAIRFGKMALKIKPESFNIHNIMGLAYFQLKQDDDAARHFLLALRYMPKDQENPVQARVQIHNQLGLLYNRQKNYKPAMVHFQESLKLDEKQPSIFNSYAMALLTCTDPALKDPVKAVKLAQQACVITKSEIPEYLGTLAVAYATVGNLSDAEKVSERALSLAKEKGDKVLIAKQQKQLFLIRQELAKRRKP